MANFGVENSRFLLLKLCEFVARNFEGFATIEGQQSAANLCKKIEAVCAKKLELFATNLYRKIRAVYAKKLELFVANLCKKLDSFVLPKLRSFVTGNLLILEQKMAAKRVRK
ncbi:Uncharacterized protein TCM_039158 [Theobroma cacao]|uniref:Uncharacterized protein n=1 Tax=Theobroma cacao TaxID=3641 RepID=A0A061GRQ5_THECC|nr:Uncharacterized protein TCM_039158 [Theobroma cacao]